MRCKDAAVVRADVGKENIGHTAIVAVAYRQPHLGVADQVVEVVGLVEESHGCGLLASQFRFVVGSISEE